MIVDFCFFIFKPENTPTLSALIAYNPEERISATEMPVGAHKNVADAAANTREISAKKASDTCLPPIVN